MPVRSGGLFAPSLLCNLPRRITGACPAELRGAYPVRRGGFFFYRAKAQRRKEIGARSVSLSAAADSLRLGVFARLPNPPRRILFFLFPLPNPHSIK